MFLWLGIETLRVELENQIGVEPGTDHLLKAVLVRNTAVLSCKD